MSAQVLGCLPLQDEQVLTMRALMIPLSFPHTPTARPPACCISVTSPLFTLPLRTISTTSMVGPASRAFAQLTRSTGAKPLSSPA